MKKAKRLIALPTVCLMVLSFAVSTVGYGGAALKPAPVADEDGWEEF